MRLVRFRRMNVLRPRAEADKARGKRTQWRKPLKEPGQKRERISIFGFASGHYSAMNESLHCLDGEEFDLCPIIQLRDSIFQERSEEHDVAMQGGQAALLDRVELAFWDNKTDLKIIASIEQHE